MKHSTTGNDIAESLHRNDSITNGGKSFTSGSHNLPVSFCLAWYETGKRLEERINIISVSFRFVFTLSNRFRFSFLVGNCRSTCREANNSGLEFNANVYLCLSGILRRSCGDYHSTTAQANRRGST